MVNRPTNGNENEFDDEFAQEDFEDTEYDDGQYDDPDALNEETEYQTDDFDGDEWNDQAQEQKPSRNNLSSEKRGLSFNTIAILGALVVGGGMLVYKVSKETAKQTSEETGFFQSLLNIGSVMDGDVFGEKEAAPGPEEIAAQERQSQEGFLNNPDAAINLTENTVADAPPAAVNGAELLTPMPEDRADGGTPRGPDETLPVQNQSAETGQQPTSAEEVLRQAMASRAQRQEQQENIPAQQTPPSSETRQTSQASDGYTDSSPAVPMAMPSTSSPQSPAPATADPSQAAQAGAALIEATAPVVHGNSAQNQTVASPVLPAPTAEAIKENSEAVVENRQALSTMQDKLDQVVDRISRLEKTPSTNQGDTVGNQKLEQEIAALKEQIAQLRATPSTKSKDKNPSDPGSPSRVNASSTKTPSAQNAKEAGNVTNRSNPNRSRQEAPMRKAAAWELRAAQPGRAWVSRRGERDMKSLMVGDRLEGIGTITSIAYQNNRWIVYGDKGQIYQ